MSKIPAGERRQVRKMWHRDQYRRLREPECETECETDCEACEGEELEPPLEAEAWSYTVTACEMDLVSGSVCWLCDRCIALEACERGVPVELVINGYEEVSG